jgi:peroxiredoxin
MGMPPPALGHEIAVCASLIANGFQGSRILKLEDLIAGRRNPGPREGEIVTGFNATSLNGGVQRIEFSSSSHPTLLYVFSPSCVWCERNSPAVGALARQVSGRYRVIGLSVSSERVKEFVAQHHIEFPVYTEPPAAIVKAYELGVTPETIMVSTNGRIDCVWTGAYQNSIKASIEQFLSVRLPALE